MFIVHLPHNSLSPPINPNSTHSTLILCFLCLNKMLAWWGGFLVSSPIEAAKLVSWNPMNYPFLRMLWHIYYDMFGRNTGSQPWKTISFNPLYYHTTSQWPQRSLQRFWNNKGHWDVLSFICLLIMGSSFLFLLLLLFLVPLKERMKKPLKVHWELAPVGGPLLLQQESSHLQLVVASLSYPLIQAVWSFSSDIFHQQMQSLASIVIFFDQQLLISLL